ncbi:MAG TPA: tRNA (adenosine(37)-N6)-threonylcarbamoyltransferase complex ATPase subunit type 1 TsaE [bacterium]
MTARTRRYRSSSPEATAAVAGRLARTFAPGTVLALVGPLGAGKTAFVKGLAAGLGLPAREVVSPTFTLVHEHAGPVPLFHADLYRLSGAEEVAELGLDDYAARGGILAIEWAERAGDALPRGAVTVTIEVSGPRARSIAVAPPPARRRAQR